MMENHVENIENPIEAVYNEHSRVLILGTMPSPESRRRGFFYSHPANRFWRALAAVLETDIPQTNEEKRALILENRIALWDVLASCDIIGSSDSSIKNAVPNDIPRLLRETGIKAVFTTGLTATKLYRRFFPHPSAPEPIPLPSPSPANQGRWPLGALVREYSAILEYIPKSR